jgi:hypothetical protein
VKKKRKNAKKTRRRLSLRKKRIRSLVRSKPRLLRTREMSSTRRNSSLRP